MNSAAEHGIECDAIQYRLYNCSVVFCAIVPVLKFHRNEASCKTVAYFAGVGKEEFLKPDCEHGVRHIAGKRLSGVSMMLGRDAKLTGAPRPRAYG